MSMVAQARPGSRHRRRRLEFETLIADLLSRLINLPAGEVDRECGQATVAPGTALELRLAKPLSVDVAVQSAGHWQGCRQSLQCA